METEAQKSWFLFFIGSSSDAQDSPQPLLVFQVTGGKKNVETLNHKV